MNDVSCITDKRTFRHAAKRAAVGFIFAFEVIFMFCVTSCGGSASETPPPLEPDSRTLLTTPATVSDKSKQSNDSLFPTTSDDSLDAPRHAAPSTWGRGKPAPLPLSASFPDAG